MTKRKYLQPMMNVVRIQSQHMLAYSEIQTSGLDERETNRLRQQHNKEWQSVGLRLVNSLPPTLSKGEGDYSIRE